MFVIFLLGNLYFKVLEKCIKIVLRCTGKVYQNSFKVQYRLKIGKLDQGAIQLKILKG